MSRENLGSKALIWGTTAIAAGVAAMMWCEWRRKNLLLNKIPTTWVPAGEISSISFYPLKSGKRTDMMEAFCTPKGLRTTNIEGIQLADRTFIVYSEKTGSFKTARQCPKMCLISVKSGANEKVIFTAPDFDRDLEISIPQADEPQNVCKLWWDEQVETIDCGAEAAAWLCSYMGGTDSSLRLGYYKNFSRSVDKPPWDKFKRFFKKLRNLDFGAYSDLSSYMLLGTNSVAELNTRLANPVTTNRFRPNIVVCGIPSYAEDNWDWVKLGKTVVLRSVKPCTRCTLINIDPDNAQVDRDGQPLKTLRGYRGLSHPAAVTLEGDSPVMGLYLGLHETGTITVGDPVYVGVAE